MGFFEDLGKKAERAKQQITDAAEQEATYGCADCETLLYTDHETCPECGSENVRPLTDD